MMPNTHRALSTRLCGELVALAEGAAEVRLRTVDDMRADERGLIHGGFVFGLADYAAMLAVNHPNVVLGSAETRFMAPVTVGEELRATARLVGGDETKQRVEVEVASEREVVLRGTFVCFVPTEHVLDTRRSIEAKS